MIDEVLELIDFPQEHFSVTQLNMYLRCPAQYFFRYVEGIKLPPSAAITKGVCVHAGAEYNYRQKIETFNDLPINEVSEYVAAKFDELKEQTEWGEEEPGKAKDETISLIKSYLRNIAPMIQPVKVEEEFIIDLDNNIKLLAYVDVIDSNGVIRDTKTARKMPRKDIADKSLQLTAYALCYRTIFNKKENGVVLDYVVNNGSTIRVASFDSKRKDEDIARLKSLINRVTDAIKKGVFYPNPTNYLCNERWCGYFDLCKKVF
jgi:CRISPR/Cas system-associated exonuclease Cas4 (RecB family)